MSKHYVDYAPHIVRQGYQVVPISKTGVPLVKGFLDDVFTTADAKQWVDRFQSCFLAVACGINDVYALDFDVNDERVAEICKKAVLKHWPDILIRTCNPNRFACLFRAHESLLEISNGNSDSFTVGGETSQIELIGNRIITISGRHRKTDNPYRWGNIRNPSRTPVHELPKLNRRDVCKIFNLFASKMKGDYKFKSKTSFSYRDDSMPDDSPDTDETGFPIKPISSKFAENKVQLYLDYFTGDDRKDWRDMGMALHVQYDGSDEGLDRWEQWSSQFDEYEKDVGCRTAWDSFKDKKNPITFASFKRRYDEEKKNRIQKDLQLKIPETLEDFEDRYVLIQNGSTVADLEAPVWESRGKFSEWKLAMKNVTTTIGEGDKVKRVPLSDMWVSSTARLTCFNTMYYPNGERMIRNVEDGSKQQYYNTYSPPHIVKTEDRDLLPIFLDHIEYLMPNKGDKEWMVNWLAQLIQDPVVRFKVAPLSISTYHNTGRGWLGQLMQKLVGVKNSSTIREIGEIIRPGAKTGFLNETTLCLINETYVNQKDRYQIDDRLRNLLGDQFQHVDIKYGEETSKNIFTRFFFQSNHVDALVLDEKDERIEVFINREPPKEKAYYDVLYRQFDKGTDFINQVWCYLMYDVKVDTSMLQSSRRTKSRDTLIRASKSPTGVGFFEFKQIIVDNLFTESMLTEFMAEYQAVYQTDTSHINSRELGFLINSQIQHRSTVRSGSGKLLKVCAFSYHDMTDVVESLNESRRKIKLYFDSMLNNGEEY